MKLSKNFDLSEFTDSPKAKELGIDNTPGENEIKAIQYLVKVVLQPLRDEKGAIEICSGYRCPILNKKVYGKSNSQHLKGEAADIKGANNAALFNYIKNFLLFDQLIWEFGNDDQPQWVHVSVTNGTNRRQLLKAVMINEEIKYLPINPFN